MVLWWKRTVTLSHRNLHYLDTTVPFGIMYKEHLQRAIVQLWLYRTMTYMVMVATQLSEHLIFYRLDYVSASLNSAHSTSVLAQIQTSERQPTATISSVILWNNMGMEFDYQIPRKLCCPVPPSHPQQPSNTAATLYMEAYCYDNTEGWPSHLFCFFLSQSFLICCLTTWYQRTT